MSAQLIFTTKTIFVSVMRYTFQPLRVFVLRNQVFWVVAPCGWVICSRRFEGTYRLHLQDYEYENWLSPEQRGSRFLQNVGNKLPNHTVQQPRRPGSSTIGENPKSWFVYFWDYFVFRIYCVVFMRYWVTVNVTIEIVIIFGRKSLFKKWKGNWNDIIIILFGTEYSC